MELLLTFTSKDLSVRSVIQTNGWPRATGIHAPSPASWAQGRIGDGFAETAINGGRLKPGAATAIHIGDTRGAPGGAAEVRGLLMSPSRRNHVSVAMLQAASTAR